MKKYGLGSFEVNGNPWDHGWVLSSPIDTPKTLWKAYRVSYIPIGGIWVKNWCSIVRVGKNLIWHVCRPAWIVIIANRLFFTFMYKLYWKVLILSQLNTKYILIPKTKIIDKILWHLFSCFEGCWFVLKMNLSSRRKLNIRHRWSNLSKTVIFTKNSITCEIRAMIKK